jgi:TolA-binding protein
MKRWLPLLAVVFLAATSDENRLYRVAQGTFGDKLYDVAERQFAEFLSRFPKSERADSAQLFLAQAQLSQGKWEVAVSNLTAGISRWPDKQPDAFRFWLGEGLVQGEHYAEAEGRYREVAEKYEKSVYRAQAMYGLAFALVKQGRFMEVIDWLDALAKLNPRGGVVARRGVLGDRAVC